MDCPYCGKEMQAGFLQSERDGRLSWDVKKRILPVFGLLSDEHFVLKTPLSSTNEVPAHKCRACKKILIDYTDLIAPL